MDPSLVGQGLNGPQHKITGYEVVVIPPDIVLIRRRCSASVNSGISVYSSLPPFIGTSVSISLFTKRSGVTIHPSVDHLNDTPLPLSPTPPKCAKGWWKHFKSHEARVHVLQYLQTYSFSNPLVHLHSSLSSPCIRSLNMLKVLRAWGGRTFWCINNNYS